MAKDRQLALELQKAWRKAPLQIAPRQRPAGDCSSKLKTVVGSSKEDPQPAQEFPNKAARDRSVSVSTEAKMKPQLQATAARKFAFSSWQEQEVDLRFNLYLMIAPPPVSLTCFDFQAWESATAQEASQESALKDNVNNDHDVRDAAINFVHLCTSAHHSQGAPSEQRMNGGKKCAYVGAHVEVLFEVNGRQDWYPGQIISKQENGKWKVLFEDNEEHEIMWPDPHGEVRILGDKLKSPKSWQVADPRGRSICHAENFLHDTAMLLLLAAAKAAATE